MFEAAEKHLKREELKMNSLSKDKERTRSL